MAACRALRTPSGFRSRRTNQSAAVRNTTRSINPLSKLFVRCNTFVLALLAYILTFTECRQTDQLEKQLHFMLGIFRESLESTILPY